MLWFRILPSFSWAVSAQGHGRWCCLICLGRWTRYSLCGIPGAGRNASVVFSRWILDPRLVSKLLRILAAQCLLALAPVSLGGCCFSLDMSCLRHISSFFSPIVKRGLYTILLCFCSVNVCYILKRLNSLAGLLKVFGWAVLSILRYLTVTEERQRILRLLYEKTWL